MVGTHYNLFTEAVPMSTHNISLVVRKPAFCICENKCADQLCSNRTADQCLCLHYIGRTIPLLPKSTISILYPSAMAGQPSLCQTWLGPVDRFSHDSVHM